MAFRSSRCSPPTLLIKADRRVRGRAGPTPQWRRRAMKHRTPLRAVGGRRLGPGGLTAGSPACRPAPAAAQPVPSAQTQANSRRWRRPSARAPGGGRRPQRRDRDDRLPHALRHPRRSGVPMWWRSHRAGPVKLYPALTGRTRRSRSSMRGTPWRRLRHRARDEPGRRRGARLIRARPRARSSSACARAPRWSARPACSTASGRRRIGTTWTAARTNAVDPLRGGPALRDRPGRGDHDGDFGPMPMC